MPLRSYTAPEEVKDLLRTLVFFEFIEDAKTLQQTLETSIQTAKAALPLINTPKVPNKEELSKKQSAMKMVGTVVIIDPSTTPIVEFEEISWKLEFM